MWNPSEILILADQGNIGFTTVIAPYLPIAGLALAGILAGIFSTYNRKRGNVETRAPDVNEIWQQQAEQSRELDSERKARRRIEDYARELLRVFRGYVWRVRGGGSIDLTSAERKYFDNEPPTSETTIQPFLKH
jgi:hypothetical protein